MRPTIRPKDIITSDNRSTSIFQRFINFLNGMVDGEFQTEEVSANVTGTKYGTMYLLDTTSGNLTLTLPDLTNNQKTKWVFVKNVGTGTNTATINPAGSETIDGGTSVVLSLNAYVMVMSTRTNWFIVGA
ncbi:MAG: hypothetical protein CMI54_01765 [Parcubacteria group bacterium]|nr:hypothetical protein [Parcubacteria group bacterium]|tara:strand:- start:6075 stop:6464 length:390 start_codon:yes stop_codon:yes gene_type:complete